MVNDGLCGSISCLGKPWRLPISAAATSAETPAVVWTTIPPAKSSVPMPASQPPPQTQWATGTYTIITHSAQNPITQLNRARSTQAPTINAGVIAAKVIWNSALVRTEISVSPCSTLIVLLSMNRSRFPIQPVVPSPKARL